MVTFGLIVARVLAPASKLATARMLEVSTLAADLGLDGADEDELYAVMDWLLADTEDALEGVARLVARGRLKEPTAKIGRAPWRERG